MAARRPSPDDGARRGTRPTATRGVVAAGHPATVDAALGALRAGGNAYDAAVAAGFAAAVAEPCLSSLGGGGFLLARTATGDATLVDFFVDTPGHGRAGPPPPLTPVTLRFGSAEQVFHVGHGSVATPGCLAGYLHVHARFGRLPLERLVAPARRLAADGVVLGPDQAAVVRLLRPTFELTEAGRAAFVPAARPFADDDVYRNPELAGFLDAVARGEVRGFEDAGVVERIDGDMRDHDGSLTADDLGAYAVQEREPLRIEVPGGWLLTNPPPSYGGSLVARAIALLEEQGPAGPAGSGARLRQLAAALAAVTDEHTAIGDGPDDGPRGGLRHGVGDTIEVAAESAKEGAPPPRPGGRGPRAAKGTTHLSIVDREGNLAAMTTSNGSGSGVVLAGTGVFANNVMGEADLHPRGFHLDPPGQRVGSMMAPSILVRDGHPDVVLGSGGSERIRSALTQVLAAILDDGLDVVTAVRAPRIHWDGRTVQVEPDLDAAAVAELATQRTVNVWARTDLYFGGVNAVDVAGTAVGDHRRGGCTGSLDEPGAGGPPTPSDDPGAGGPPTVSSSP